MKYTFLFLFCCLMCACASAQRRFSAAAELGFTASQLDGDLSAGYNKLGSMAGLRGIINLKKKTQASIGFVFAQRGAQDEISETDPDVYSITLNYVEMPILFHYADWEVKDGDETYYRAYVSGGFSYGRLLGTRLKDTGIFAKSVIEPVNPPPGRSNYLNDHDLSINIGASIFFTRRLGASFKWMRSATFVYNPKKWDPAHLPQRGWNAHSLSFSLMYTLI
jgi:Outer membrane protein beta-barrel domain